MLLMLPALIAQTGLLSFISRLFLEAGDNWQRLKEVPLKDATMRRRLVVTYRENSYLSPASKLLVSLLSSQARREASGRAS
jgi:DNA-binding transcriptional LysR family regulator